MLSNKDLIAISQASEAMTQRMLEASLRGRSGWDDPEECSAPYLRALLRKSVQDGDAVDVMNYAMMLFNRREPTHVEGEKNPCYDEGCPFYGKDVDCQPKRGGCIATSYDTPSVREGGPVKFVASPREDASSSTVADVPPEVHSVWRHKSGKPYVVIGYSNEQSTDPDRYPVTIYYADIEGRVWSRPLSRWHESMTLANDPAVAGMVDSVQHKLNPWYGAITDACAIANINWHMDNQHRTINDLLNYHIEIALDPRVSSDAAALVEEGRKAGAMQQKQQQPEQSEATDERHPKTWSSVQNHMAPNFMADTPTRYSVPGGWIVKYEHSITFVPDPHHQWM